MSYSRRGFALSLAATGALGACGRFGAPHDAAAGAARIDGRIDATLAHMYAQYPGTRTLADNAAGMLVMPLITEAGLGIGGAYGRGALRIGGQSVDYYSAAKASAGLQIGAQQYTHVLFFMTSDALQDFRYSDGWAVGADIEYAISADGRTVRADTTTSLSPVIAVVFAQAGLRVGATLEGVKYTRITP